MSRDADGRICGPCRACIAERDARPELSRDDIDIIVRALYCAEGEACSPSEAGDYSELARRLEGRVR